jgi:hypothetical protein
LLDEIIIRAGQEFFQEIKTPLPVVAYIGFALVHAGSFAMLKASMASMESPMTVSQTRWEWRMLLMEEPRREWGIFAAIPMERDFCMP